MSEVDAIIDRKSRQTLLMIFSLISYLGLWGRTATAQTPFLDTTFASEGTLKEYIVAQGVESYYGSIYGVKYGKGGKIVVAGSSEGANGDWAFALARYDMSGVVDTTFGYEGYVRTAIGGGSGTDDECKGIAIQSDGKVVVGGYSAGGSGYSFAVARYDTNGSLDSTFGTDGIVRSNITGGTNDDYGYAVAIGPDGKIVVAGQSLSPSGCAIGVARYDTNGALDETFGTNGNVRTNINGGGSGIYDGAYALAIQGDGKIVVAGFSENTNTGHSAFAVIRYKVDGSLDSTFGTNGCVTSQITGGGNNDFGYGVAIQSDGKIVVSGRSQGITGYAFAIARYNVNGSIDSTFGTGGSTRTSIAGGNGSYDEGNSVAMQPDGKIVVAGLSAGSPGYAFAVARYDTNGSLDSTFGTLRTTIAGGSGTDRGYAVMIQPDGKIVVAGRSVDQYGYQAFGLARYLPPDSTTTGVRPSPAVEIEFSLDQNYPNPFNPETVISYKLPENSRVKLEVFNILGEKVMEFAPASESAGVHEQTLNMTAFPSGVYFLHLTAGRYVRTIKLVLLK